MGPKDGFPIAMKLQNELMKLYGYCHLMVVAKGYWLQTVRKGKMHAEILPFDAAEDSIERLKKAFAQAYADKPAAKEPAQTGAVEQEPDAKPKRRTRKPADPAG